jgi:hypothetical protein
VETLTTYQPDSSGFKSFFGHFKVGEIHLSTPAIKALMDSLSSPILAWLAMDIQEPDLVGKGKNYVQSLQHFTFQNT